MWWPVLNTILWSAITESDIMRILSVLDLTETIHFMLLLLNVESSWFVSQLCCLRLGFSPSTLPMFVSTVFKHSPCFSQLQSNGVWFVFITCKILLIYHISCKIFFTDNFHESSMQSCCSPVHWKRIFDKLDIALWRGYLKLYLHERCVMCDASISCKRLGKCWTKHSCDLVRDFCCLCFNLNFNCH